MQENLEIEIKAIVKDLEDVEKRLKGMGAFLIVRKCRRMNTLHTMQGF